MKLFHLILTATLLTTLPGCKLEISVPENGTVTTASGAYSCGAGETCTIEVDDTSFDQTFIARPAPGYTFSRWLKKPHALCPNQNRSCRLDTSTFGDNEELMAILESDSTYYLEPVFVKQQEYDFESGTLDLACSGNCPTVSNKYARSGEYSMEAYLNRLTSPTAFRTEAVIPGQAKTMEWETDYWIGFSMYLPSGWEAPSTDEGQWEILMQIHSASSGNGGPPLRIETRTGNWQVMSRAVAGPYKVWTLNSVFEDVGRWTDWVIHIRPSQSSTGILQIWKDGAYIGGRNGPNTYAGDEEGPYLKLGIYSGPRERDCCKNDRVEKWVYYDALRIASGPDAVYDDVAPR